MIMFGHARFHFVTTPELSTCLPYLNLAGCLWSVYACAEGVVLYIYRYIDMYIDTVYEKETVHTLETRGRYQSPAKTTVRRIAALRGLTAVTAHYFETGRRSY